MSVGQTLAAKLRQRIDPDQELIGLGAANIAAGQRSLEHPQGPAHDLSVMLPAWYRCCRRWQLLQLEQFQAKWKPLFRGVALVAAFMLVLQAFTMAAAGANARAPGGAATAGGPMLDIFGNPLCITSAGHGTSQDDPAGVPACCTFGCSHASSFPGNGACEHRWPARPLAASLAGRSHPTPVHRQGPDHDPSIPRAPPLAA